MDTWSNLCSSKYFASDSLSLSERKKNEFRVFAVPGQSKGGPTTNDETMSQAQFDVPGEAGGSMGIDDKTSIKNG